MVKPSECPRPLNLIECDTVYDIGPGIRPMGWYKPKRHICVEPYGPYAAKLVEAGHEVVQQDVYDFLAHRRLTAGAAVYMLDVIEHMEKNEGLRVLSLIRSDSPAQIVVFTPNGFLPQEEDAWGLGGGYWQKHRSGWRPEDFPGWKIEMSEPPLHASFTATLMCV